MTGRGNEDDRLDREDLRVFRAAPDERSGRQAASRLLKRHQDRVYAWCYRYVEDHERALELAQDVMLNAYRKLPVYEHRARFSSWLFVIARNRCLRDLRRPPLRRELGLDPDTLRSGARGPGRELEERQAEQRLWRLIDRHLEPAEQDALRLRCLEGLPVAAITRILRVQDRSGARGLLQRARRKLRAALDRDDPGRT